MKIGDLLKLPSDAYKIGQYGDVIENEKIVGRYQVIEEGNMLLGRVITTYGHGGRKRNAKRSAGHRKAQRMVDAMAHKMSRDA